MRVKCEQIEPLLEDYVKGTLPSYKSAWAFQHLAGCEGCRARLEGLRTVAAGRRIQTEPEPERSQWTAASAPRSGRRRRPRALRWLVTLCLLTLLGALGLVAWQAYHHDLDWVLNPSARAVMARWGGEEPQAQYEGQAQSSFSLVSGQLLPVAPWSPPYPEGRVLSFRSSRQSQEGVSLTVRSVEQHGDKLLVHARFDGRHLLPPGNRDGWLQVYHADDQALAGSVESLLVDRSGFSVYITIPVEESLERFRLSFQEIGQEVVLPWRLELPEPPERLHEARHEIHGFPSGLHLERYGIANHVLSATVTGAFLEGLDASPRLYLQDATGQRVTPQDQQFLLARDGKSTIVVQYPVPRVWQTPLWLVGEGVVRKNLGSWTIDITVIK